MRTDGAPAGDGDGIRRRYVTPHGAGGFTRCSRATGAQMSGPNGGGSDPSASPAKVLGLADAVAMIVGIVVGAGIFRAPSLVAANAASETCGAPRMGGGRSDRARRRALLRRAGDHLSQRRRGIPLPAPGVRWTAGVLPRVGPPRGDPDRLDRAARVRVRRLRHARAPAGRTLGSEVRGARRARADGGERRRGAPGRGHAEVAHRARGGGDCARRRGGALPARPRAPRTRGQRRRRAPPPWVS